MFSKFFKTKEEITTYQAAETLYIFVTVLIKSEKRKFEEIINVFKIKESDTYRVSDRVSFGANDEVFFCICSMVYIVSSLLFNQKVVYDILEKYLNICENQISPENATLEDRSIIWSNLLLRIDAYTVVHNVHRETNEISGIMNLFVLILSEMRFNRSVKELLNVYASLRESLGRLGTEEKKKFRIISLLPDANVTVLFMGLFGWIIDYITEFSNKYNIK